MRTPPVAGPHERRPGRVVQFVDGGLLARRATCAGERPQVTGVHGGRDVVGFVSANDDPVARAQSRCDDSMHALPWHGSHRDGGVPLEELHGVEPLRDGLLQLLVRHVHAEASRTACHRAPTPRAAGRRDRPAASASRASVPISSTSTSRPTAAAASRPGQPALRDRRVDGTSPGDGPGRVDVRRELHREVRLRGLVERRARRRSWRAGSSTAWRTPPTRPGRRRSCCPSARPVARRSRP